MKKLKTGEKVKFDVKKCLVLPKDRWLTIYPHTFMPISWPTRKIARLERIEWWPGQRIARILSIGPQYVTVRISK